MGVPNFLGALSAHDQCIISETQGPHHTLLGTPSFYVTPQLSMLVLWQVCMVEDREHNCEILCVLEH